MLMFRILVLVIHEINPALPWLGTDRAIGRGEGLRPNGAWP